MESTLKTDITRGGQFLVKETKCEDVFTPEDFSEEQIMMRDMVKEFVDKEIWPNKDRFENKDYAFTVECMKKAGDSFGSPTHTFHFLEIQGKRCVFRR